MESSQNKGPVLLTRLLLPLGPISPIAWTPLAILPRSAMYETFEALHMTTLGACPDWKTMAYQDLRTALAYSYSTLFGSSLATEALFGVPVPTESKASVDVNYRLLKEDHVNVLLHGHCGGMIRLYPISASYSKRRRTPGRGTRGAPARCSSGEWLAGEFKWSPRTASLRRLAVLAFGNAPCTGPGGSSRRTKTTQNRLKPAVR